MAYKSQKNHFHFFTHYEWFEPKENTISKRNVILIRASVVLKRTDGGSDMNVDNICTDTLPLNWHITSAFSINKVQVLTTYTLVRTTSVNANVKLIRAIE